MINLYLHYFSHKNKNRQLEIHQCIMNNINNKYIDRIYLILENREDINNEYIIEYNKNKKVYISTLNKRLNFSEIFTFVNSVTHAEDINIVSNLDIYFDDTISKILEKDMDKKLICLTRWDKNLNDADSKLFNVSYSQDSWIWKGEIVISAKSNFYMGIPGCDNILCGIYYEMGYDILNPAYDIISHHIHNDLTRDYTNKDIIRNMKMYLVPPSYKWNNGVCKYWITYT